MHTQNSQARPSASSSWPSALDWWTPIITCSSAINTRTHQSFLALHYEWQTFVARRVKEDFHLVHEIARAKAPNEIWNASSRFWQKAVEDYWKEYGLMAQLGTGFIASGIATTTEGQGASPQEIAVPHAKAA